MGDENDELILDRKSVTLTHTVSVCHSNSLTQRERKRENSHPLTHSTQNTERERQREEEREKEKREHTHTTRCDLSNKHLSRDTTLCISRHTKHKRHSVGACETREHTYTHAREKGERNEQPPLI